MLLTIRILTYRNQPVAGAAPVRFPEDGGTLGRSADNDLVLDDPAKYVSRLHAHVVHRDGQYLLADAGANPSVVNDRPLGKGREVALAHGDRIVVGDYLLQVMFEADPMALSAETAAMPGLADGYEAAPPIAAPLPVPVAAPEYAPVPSRPRGAEPGEPPRAQPADTLAQASILRAGGARVGGGGDPLGLDLYGDDVTAMPPHGTESDHVSPELAAFPAAPGAAPEPYGRRAAASGPGGAYAIPADYDPLADLLPRPQAPLVAPSSRVAAPAPHGAGAVPAHEAPAGAAPQAGTAAAAPPARPQPAGPAAYVAGRAGGGTTAQPIRSGQQADGSGDDVMAALLRGLGLPELRLDRPAVEVAETVGALLRAATAGTMDVLMARALTKKESRIDMTMLAVRSNNPLKFFPTAEGALTQMLTCAMAGYLPPVDAMAAAFDDLRAHELAVIAGMQAALRTVLARFDPAAIEAQLPPPGLREKVMSTHRKAALWQALVAAYDGVARDADDTFQKEYQKEFAQAYQEQVARLRQAKGGAA